jgi:hypothetical protein
MIGPSARPRPNPPDWFNEQRYHYLRNLDARGWLAQLERCKMLRGRVSLRQWESVGEKGWTKKYVPAFIGPPVVEIVERADQATLHEIEKPAFFAKVYLRAPDGIIIKEFEKALKEARRSVPAPVKKPGPRGAGPQFTRTEFSRWLDYRIVELCELEDWRRKLRRKKARERIPTDADLAHWLFSPRYANPRKQIIAARQTLLRAIGQIPALWAQVEGAFVPGN